MKSGDAGGCLRFYFAGSAGAHKTCEGKVLIERLKKFAEALGTESPSRLSQQAKYLLRPKSAGMENGVSNSMRLGLGTLAGGSRWGLKIYLREQGNHRPPAHGRPDAADFFL